MKLILILDATGMAVDGHLLKHLETGPLATGLESANAQLKAEGVRLKLTLSSLHFDPKECV